MSLKNYDSIKVIGVDPGLNHTGWAVISNYNKKVTLINYGVISTNPKHKFHHRLKTIYEKFIEVLQSYKPQFISIEEIFYDKNFPSVRKLISAKAVILLCASIFNLQLYQFAPFKIKKNIVGFGNADKEQVKYMIRQQFSEIKEDVDDHITDAIAIALCLMRELKL